MNFTRANLDLVLAGIKTQTRRKPHNGTVTNNPSGGLWIECVDRHSFHVLYRKPIHERVIDTVWGGQRGYERKLWAVGDVLAACPGRGKLQEGKIRITRIRHERLQDISEEDAIAEGCESVVLNGIEYTAVNVFESLWDSIYHGQPGKQWADNPYVFVLDFELVSKTEAT